MWRSTGIYSDISARKICRKCTTPHQEGEKKISIPLLRQSDLFVRPEGQGMLCDRADDRTKVYCCSSRHKILMETDSIRDVALENIKSFLQKFID